MIPIILIFLPLAYSMDLTYAIIEGNLLATLVLLFIFQVIFLAGLVLLLVGILKKNEVQQL